MATHILIIDDEKNYLLLLETMLTEEGYAVTTQQDPQLALDYLGESEVDVVITDMKMPQISGQKVLEEVKRHHPHIPVLIMTAFGSIDGAVEAMKCGAFDYITKPFSNDELLLSVSKAGKLAQAERENRLLRQSLEDRFGVHQIIGRSKAVRDVLQMIERVAASRSTVLLTGESGTGKELVARGVHFASDRANAPFVPVNCMALNPGVLESELFGHEKGSFSGAVARRRGRFEMAHTGTLFLDEIGELSQETQVKLLRVLQERTFERVGGSTPVQVDIRLIAATNKDLAAAVAEGTFREDLYYRLNVVQIQLPALRERREDIPLLAAHFLKRYADENNAAVTEFAPDAVDYLTAFEWPGNVRQLENVVERCVVLSRSSQITVNDLPPEVKDEESQFKSAVDLLPSKLNLGESLEKIEAALIRRALAKSSFIQVKAADMLGISKSLLQYKLKKYNISGK